MFPLLKRLIRFLQGLPVGNEPYRMSKEMRDRFRAPAVNVDGTPMVGRHDIRGRGYGVSRRFGSRRY